MLSAHKYTKYFLERIRETVKSEWLPLDRESRDTGKEAFVFSLWLSIMFEVSKHVDILFLTFYNIKDFFVYELLPFFKLTFKKKDSNAIC